MCGAVCLGADVVAGPVVKAPSRKDARSKKIVFLHCCQPVLLCALDAQNRLQFAWAKSISLNSGLVGATSNVFQNLRTRPTQCTQSFSDIRVTQDRKMVQKLGILEEKHVFYIHILVNHLRIFGPLTWNHCMI